VLCPRTAHCRVELARTLALVEIAAAEAWSRLHSQEARQDSTVEGAATNALRALASEHGVSFISFVRQLELLYYLSLSNPLLVGAFHFVALPQNLARDAMLRCHAAAATLTVDARRSTC
jgi:hypothetical protein